MEKPSFRERQIAFCRANMPNRAGAIEELNEAKDATSPVGTGRFERKPDFSALDPRHFNVADRIATCFSKSKARIHLPQDEAPMHWTQNPRYIMTQIVQRAIEILEHEETGKIIKAFNDCAMEYMTEATAPNAYVLKAIAEIQKIIQVVVFAEELEKHSTPGILILATGFRIKRLVS